MILRRQSLAMLEVDNAQKVPHGCMKEKKGGPQGEVARPEKNA
jgi:hypothetical protein